MKISSGFALTVGILMALIPMYSWGQTLMEQQTAIKMSEELNNTSTGPSMSRIRPPSPVNPPAPGPSVIRPPAPVSPAGPASAGASAPPAPGGGPARMVKAPENGFEPTRAAQKANVGFELMHDMRFDEAVDFYRQAMEADEKYAPAYQGMLQAVNQIKQYGAETVGQIVMTEQPVKVTIAEYFGWQ